MAWQQTAATRAAPLPEQQQKRGAVVHHEPETLEQLEPTITRLAQRLVLADRLCGPKSLPDSSCPVTQKPRDLQGFDDITGAGFEPATFGL